MRLIFAMLALLIFAAGCEKNNLTTKPKLKIKEVNATEIFGTQHLQFTIELSDKEADFTQFFGFRKNVPTCINSSFMDTTRLQIPQEFILKKEQEGDIFLDMDIIIRGSNQCPGPGSTFKTDTATFSFWTKDAAGNISDTVHSDVIIIHQ